MTTLRTAQMIEALGVGGAERLAVQIANAHAASHERSCLYVLTEPGPMSQQVDSRVRVKYFGLKRRSIFNPVGFLRFLVPAMRRLAGAVNEDGLQVVQTHLPYANYLGLGLSLKGDCRIVATIHNTQEFKGDSGDNALRIALRKRAYREILKRCAATVAVSEEVREAMLEQLGLRAGQVGRFDVIPNGVPVPDRVGRDFIERVRRNHGWSIDTPLVLAAGRLTEQKNFGTLIEAAALLAEREVVCQVVVAGEGELGAGLRKQAVDAGLGEVVHLPGALSDIGDVMLAADVFTLPSLWEGLPLVVLEAMAAGLPVVSSRLPGLDDVVGNGAGLLVEKGDAAALADGLQRMLLENDLREKCGGTGRELILDRYEFGQVAEKTGQLLRSVAPGADGATC